MEKITVGTGLTAHSVTTYAFEDWIKLDSRLLDKAVPAYPAYLVQLRDWAQGILTTANRPTQDTLVHVGANGTWCYVPDVEKFDTGARGKLIRGLDYSQDEEEATLVWYASRILRCVFGELALLRPPTNVRSHSQARARSGQHRRVRDLSMRANACQLGVLVERTRWKFRHEKAALFGHAHAASRESWQAGGARARKAKGDKTTKALEPYLNDALKRAFDGRSKPTRPQLEKLKPNTVIRLMRAVASDKVIAGISESTLRRHVKKLLERRIRAAKK